MIDCKQLAGWAQDEDTPTQAIAVHFYFDGPAGDSKAQGLPMVADKTRADLCKPLGSCDHAFDFSPPLSMMDGNEHPVFVYAIDSSGNGNNPEIGNGTLKCATPAPPVDAAHGIKRWVTTGELTGDMSRWPARTETFATIYATHEQALALGQALVQSIPGLRSTLLSPDARRLWLETWQAQAGGRSEFTLPLRLMDVAVRFLNSGDPPDPRVLLELQAEERSLLKPLLGVEEDEEDKD